MKVNTTYEPYSQQLEYIQANREFLASLPLDKVTEAIDLACGTGVMTELLFERRSPVSVIGIDISTESLDIARSLFEKKQLLVQDKPSLDQAISSGKSGVLLIRGSADELTLESERADLVLMGGSIHLLPDKDKLLQGIRQVLRPGGLFAFNTVFYVGTYPEGTERFYTEWLKEALGVLEEKNDALRAAGKNPIPRQRGKVGRAFNKGWMSPTQWTELLQSHGFVVIQEYQRPVMMTQQNLETVGAYSGLAEVLMSGYPVEVASECLQVAARRVFQKLDIQEVPRLWLEIGALKQ